MTTATKNAKTGTTQADKLKTQADALMIKKQLLAVRNGDLRSRVDLVVQTLKDNADTLTRKTGLSMPKEDAWVATVKVEDARHGIQATLEKCRAPQVKPADLKAPAKPYLKNTGIDLLKEMVSRLKEQNQQLTRESTLINAHLKHGCLLLNQHLEVFSLEDEWDGLVTVPHEQAMATLSEIQSLLDRMADERMIKRQSITIPREKPKQGKAANTAKTKAAKRTPACIFRCSGEGRVRSNCIATRG